MRKIFLLVVLLSAVFAAAQCPPSPPPSSSSDAAGPPGAVQIKGSGVTGFSCINPGNPGDTLVSRGLGNAPVMQSPTPLLADTGVADAYVVTPSPAYTAYSAGMTIRFKAVHANTGASTLKVNALAAKALDKVSSGVLAALAANDIGVNAVVVAVYDGTQFQVTSIGGGAVDLSSPGPIGGTVPSTITGTTINATVGYQVGGAAPNGYILQGDGVKGTYAEPGLPTSIQTGANYPIPATAKGYIVTRTNASMADTIAQCGVGAFDAYWAAIIKNVNASVSETITPTTSTVNGVAAWTQLANGWGYLACGDTSGNGDYKFLPVPPMTSDGKVAKEALPVATATTAGAVPTPPNDATKVLSGAATWITAGGAATGSWYIPFDSMKGTGGLQPCGGTQTTAYMVGEFTPAMTVSTTGIQINVQALDAATKVDYSISTTAGAQVAHTGGTIYGATGWVRTPWSGGAKSLTAGTTYVMWVGCSATGAAIRLFGLSTGTYTFGLGFDLSSVASVVDANGNVAASITMPASTAGTSSSVMRPTIALY